MSLKRQIKKFVPEKIVFPGAIYHISVGPFVSNMKRKRVESDSGKYSVIYDSRNRDFEVFAFDRKRMARDLKTLSCCLNYIDFPFFNKDSQSPDCFLDRVLLNYETREWVDNNYGVVPTNLYGDLYMGLRKIIESAIRTYAREKGRTVKARKVRQLSRAVARNILHSDSNPKE